MRNTSFLAVSAGFLFGAWLVGTAPVVQAAEAETADGTNQVQLRKGRDAQDIEKRLEILEKQVATQQTLKQAQERTADSMALSSVGGF